MTRFDDVTGSPPESGEKAEEINLLSWFELQQALINATADILKDDLDIVKRRKITPHTSILKEEKGPAALLSKSIVVGFHDAISKAVKDLQNFESQMYEGIRDRFNLSDDWVPSGSSVAASGVGSDVSGHQITITRKEMAESERRSQLGLLLDDNQNQNLNVSNESTESIANDSDPENTELVEALQITSKNKSPSPDEDEVLSSDTNDLDMVPASDDDLRDNDELTKDVKNHVAKDVSNPYSHRDKSSQIEEKTINSPSPANKSSDSVSDGSGKKSTRSNLLDNGHGAGAKSKNKSPVTTTRSIKERMKGLGSQQLACSDRTAEKEENINIDNSTNNQDLPPDDFCVKKINLNTDLDDTQTVLVTTTPPMSKPVKASRDEAESEEVENETVKTLPAKVEPVSDVEDNNNPDTMPQSLIAHATADTDQKADGLNQSKKANRPDMILTEKVKKKIAMSKSEQAAMKAILGSSSESDADFHKPSKSRNDKVTRKSVTAISSEIGNGNDPKLKEGATVVVVDKLTPCIEKTLAKDGYVQLKHLSDMKKQGRQTNYSLDSNSNSACESDDSLQNYRTALKNLQRSSVLQSVRHNEKQGSQPKRNRKTKYVKRKDDQIFDGMSSGSGSDSRLSEDDANSLDSNNLMRNSKRNAIADIYSSSGSEDLEHEFVENGNESRKTLPQSPATKSQQKNDANKKKYYVAVSSSDTERDNMKAVLGSESESESEISKKSSKKPTDSDLDTVGKQSRKRRRGKSDSSCEIISSESDPDFKDNKKKKRKRRRVVTISSDSSNKNFSDDSDVQVIPQDEEASLSQKGRKNIRKILSSKELRLTTREAEKKEEERRKRVAEKQKMYNGFHNAPETSNLKRLILDFDPETKEPCVEVDESMVKKLKPHQAEGIKFMYNACFESVEMIKKNQMPGGCILAHCMGLGKTLQTVAFLHTLITNKLCEIKTALVICPLSTANNWFNEIRQWTENCDNKVRIHRIFEAKNTNDRKDYLRGWQRIGGIGLINYDLFRVLVDPKGKSKMKESDRKVIEETLLDPGPDIVVCDEGHLLKNSKSMLSLSVNKLGTVRRVVLTGTPLQNNLTEYHTMMSFVKPGLLGDIKEFTNRFANPIKNGQHKDSTDTDVRIMKRRSHVLHRKLEGCVQRCDYSILSPYLPPKHEYIINIRLTEPQEQLYKYYLEYVVDRDPQIRTKLLLKCFSELVKVWSHPIALTMRREKAKDGDGPTSQDESLKDFIVDDSAASDVGSEKGGGGKKIQSKKKRRALTAADLESGNSNQEAPEVGFTGFRNDFNWWTAVFKSKEEMQDVEISGKLVVLQEILKTCEIIGDKILVFSQFLTSLDIIEEFLAEWDKEAEQRQKNESSMMTRFPLSSIGCNEGRWRRGVEYFRIDGQRKVSDRQRDCEKFNKKSYSKAKLFLISTKAGGLGINLFGANRVVIFDASWNPSQDMQSIFRVYRFGQDKPCYIYRLISRGTMEEKILRRQITKLSLSSRVVDEHQIERHFKFDDVNELFRYDEEDINSEEHLAVPKDRLLADLLISHKHLIRSYEEFDSLLENKPEEQLSNEEKEMAWEEYRRESEHQRRVILPSSESGYTVSMLRQRLTDLHPLATQNQIESAIATALQVIRRVQDWSPFENSMLDADTAAEIKQLIYPLREWLQHELRIPLAGVQSTTAIPPGQPLTRPLPPIFHLPARLQSLPVHIRALFAEGMPPPGIQNNAPVLPPQPQQSTSQYPLQL